MSEQFANGLLRISVGQACQREGYDSCESSAADVMVEVVRKYVESIGRTTLHRAELTGRARPDVRDVLEALKDLRPDMGQQAWMNLAQEVHAMHEKDEAEPFPTFVPRFPVQLPAEDLAPAADGDPSASASASASASGGKHHVLGKHVPDFMPPPPPDHTYKRTRLNAVRRSSAPKRQRERFLQQKRQTQIALNAVEAGTTHPRYVPSHARTETARGGAQAGAEHAGAGGSWGQGRSDAEMYGERATQLRLGPAGALGSGIGGDDGGGASAGSAIEVYKELDLNEQILCGKFDDEGS